jgi:acetyl-CoA synthetase (ADP-forming)
VSVTLSEADSKSLIARYGVPVVAEHVVTSAADAVRAADDVGYPCVVKLNGPGIAHKTERGLVKLGQRTARDVHDAATSLLDAVTPDDGPVSLIVARQLSGRRELIAGVVRDPQFGPAVMLGVGGVLAEAIADVAFRLVPVSRVDALELIDDLTSQRLLHEWRGEPPVDRERLVDVVLALSQLAAQEVGVLSVDVNPLIIESGVPVAVDALVEVATGS